MPIPFDRTPVSELGGLSRPLLAFADLAHLDILTFIVMTVMLTAVAALILTRPRGRTAATAASVNGSSLSQEEALGHLRRVRAELKGRKGEAAVADVLARAGLAALHDVVLQDGRGLTQVDHLVRLPGGIAVLETKTFAGMVTGSIRDRHWAQHLREGEVRTAFLNPLLQNHRHVQATRELAGVDVLVFGLVVSAGAGQFCGELGAVVVRLDELAVRLQAATARCDPGRVDAAWARLTAAAACGAALRGAHGEQMRRRRGEVC